MEYVTIQYIFELVIQLTNQFLTINERDVLTLSL